jgi:hypothetical protein
MGAHTQTDTCASKADHVAIEDAARAEIQKLHVQMRDLEDTVSTLLMEQSERNNELNELELRYKSADTRIKNELNARLRAEKTTLSSLLRKREEVVEKETLREQLKELIIARDALIRSPETKKSKESRKDKPSPVDVGAVNKLCGYITSRLIAWALPDTKKVWFDTTTLDLVLTDTPRANFGKGNRAIAYSSFTLGLMDYCVDEKLPHPSFVVLDSPLTTFRQGDKEKGEKNEDVSEGVENSFFTDLTAISNSKQIIIFENKEPPADLHRKMNYIHFSGSASQGRKGFFPL